jgi:cation diffusion facilitator CzcD-associated flavoprotein CzcO
MKRFASCKLYSVVKVATEIAVFGAGLAGLACARSLADAGRNVTVFDKARGPGGAARLYNSLNCRSSWRLRRELRGFALRVRVDRVVETR